MELGEPLSLHWSDRVRIARRAWPELKGNGGHGLANLKQILRLHFHHHDAGEDARAAALVVLHAEARLAMPYDEIALLVPKAPRLQNVSRPTTDRFIRQKRGCGMTDSATPQEWRVKPCRAWAGLMPNRSM
jgi:DNA polymerase III epsilon subunit-like protein